MFNYWKTSKDKTNHRGIFTLPPNNCCPPVQQTCCTESTLHSQFPGPYSIMGRKTILFGAPAMSQDSFPCPLGQQC